MASKGLHLEKFGVRNFWFILEKGEPEKVRYRFLADRRAITKRLGVLTGRKQPDKEEREAYADFGWEYMDVYSAYAIYRSADPAATELETDPQVTALALRAVRRWEFQSIGLFFFAVAGLLVMNSMGMLWERVIEAPLYCVAAVLLIPWGLYLCVSDLRWSGRRLRILDRGESLDRTAAKQSVRYQIVRGITLCLVLLLILGQLGWTASALNLGQKSGNTVPYDGQTGFPTMDEIVPAQAREEGDFFAGVYTLDRNLLCKKAFLWWEDKKVESEYRRGEPGFYMDGPPGWYLVNSYDMRFDWLGRWVTDQIYRREFRKVPDLAPIPGLENLPLALYYFEYDRLNMLIQKDSQVLWIWIVCINTEGKQENREAWLTQFVTAFAA